MPTWFLLLALMAPGAPGARPVDPVDHFIRGLHQRVPELMRRYMVPSVAVAVGHEGWMSYNAWGTADVAEGRPAADETQYNVASVTKLLTAWAVMQLVEDGRIALDDPVAKHVRCWRVPSDAITVRQLLSHTAGLSMPAVPQYDGPPPPLEQELEAVVAVEPPGRSYRYSGGGFGVLQMLLEEVTGVPYEAYMREEVLRSLGMNWAGFKPSAFSAVPYDASLRPLPNYRFAASAAAGLYTSVMDLGTFAGQKPPAEMLTAAPSVAKTPFRYGLGYNLIALPSGKLTAGHTGSNDGWTALLDTIPSTGDSLVVLMNRSDGFPVYRELLCEWLSVVAGETWPGFCGPRDEWTWAEEDGAFVDGSFARESAAVLIAIGDKVVHRKAYGARLTPETPFYIASLAKSLTSHVVLALVAEGKMALNDPVRRWLPGAPAWMREVTIEQLLSHTSGIPDYYGLIDWPTYDGIDNAEVLALLAAKGKPEFAPGNRYAYSNSGYVLLAMAVENCTGMLFADVLRRKLGLTQTTVYDGKTAAPDGRAIGTEKGQLSDYLEFVLPNGKNFQFRATTYGAGGIFSTVDDLYRLTRLRNLPFALEQRAMFPVTPVEGEIEVPETAGHGFGWFVSRRGKTNVVWNAGGMAGHKTFLVRVPQYDATIVVLANRGEAKPVELAMAIVDRMLAKKK